MRRLRAAFVLGFDGNRHRMIRDGVVEVTDDGRLGYVGPAKDYAGSLDAVEDTGHTLIAPGLINLHCHAAGAPLGRSIAEDAGNPAFFMSGLYDTGTIRATSDEETRDVLAYSLAELIRSGVTTVVDVGGAPWVDVFQRVGLRSVLVPSYRSAAWEVKDGRSLTYQWDEAAGLEGLDQAHTWLQAHHDPEGLITGMLGPAQVDTCSEELLRATRDLAERLNCRITIHAAQSHTEVGVMLQRHKMSALEYLDSVGLLGPDVIVAHAILNASHPDSNIAWSRDIELLRDRGAHIAHCPWVFGRRGTMMHSLGAYRRQGINVGIGTDTCPQDMLREMLFAVVLSKAAENHPLSVTAGDVVEAATLAGARALGRQDLGRLETGAQADLILVDCDHPSMAPVRDPLRSLIYGGGSRAVQSVMVAGRWLMEDYSVHGLDETALSRRVQAIGERIWREAPQRDAMGRTVDEIAPPSVPWW